MAKARRNLTQLRKDNRTANLPAKCGTVKCDHEFYVKPGAFTSKRKCRGCFENPPQDRRKDATLLKLKGYGIL